MPTPAAFRRVHHNLLRAKRMQLYQDRDASAVALLTAAICTAMTRRCDTLAAQPQFFDAIPTLAFPREERYYPPMLE